MARARRRRFVLIAAASHAAEKKYGTGVSDTEIKLGQTFSGAATI